MVQLNESFDPSTVDDSGFDLLPIDRDFMVQGIESNMKDNNAKTGTIITLTLEVMEGEFERRRVWLRFNYTNNSAQAQEIARRDLKKVLAGLGLEALNDTEELLWTPFMCRLGIEKGSGNYDDRNNVKRAWPVGTESPYAGRSGSKASAGPGGARPGPAANNNRPPLRTVPPGATGGGNRSGATGGPGGGKPWGAAAQRQAPKPDMIDEEIPF